MEHRPISKAEVRLKESATDLDHCDTPEVRSSQATSCDIAPIISIFFKKKFHVVLHIFNCMLAILFVRQVCVIII